MLSTIKYTFTALAFLIGFTPTNNFKTEQLKSGRVKVAYAQKWNDLKKQIHSLGVDTSNFQLFFRAFKKEEKFEIWIKNAKNTSYQLFKTLPVCASSGELGPKIQQGDGQVPEGFYHINAFNPYSNYYLSLKVSYPNKADKIRSAGKNPGGDIFVHGSCVTIGCLPLTDDLIKEVYVLAVESKNKGYEIPVHIFPFKLSKSAIDSKRAGTTQQIIKHWENLLQGYSQFEADHVLPKVTIDSKGQYVFK